MVSLGRNPLNPGDFAINEKEKGQATVPVFSSIIAKLAASYKSLCQRRGLDQMLITLFTDIAIWRAFFPSHVCIYVHESDREREREREKQNKTTTKMITN